MKGGLHDLFDELMQALGADIDLEDGEEQPPKMRAANDNDLPWPLIPFPDGWYAAC